jgi:hypothetical protein
MNYQVFLLVLENKIKPQNKMKMKIILHIGTILIGQNKNFILWMI